MPALSRLKAYWRFWLLGCIVLVADQLSKLWVLAHIPAGSYHSPHIVLIDGWLNLVHIYNEGAAWGMFSGFSGWLALLAIVALAGLYVFRHSFGMHLPLNQWLFGGICGGIVGNFIDRIAYGHVVDFIDITLPFSIPVVLEGGRWPAFNIADCGITVGILIYIALNWRTPPQQSTLPTPKAHPPLSKD